VKRNFGVGLETVPKHCFVGREQAEAGCEYFRSEAKKNGTTAEPSQQTL